MNADLQSARELLLTEGLSFPPMPIEMASKLRKQSPFTYATGELNAPPYALEVHVNHFLRSSEPRDFAVLSLDGHGTNSWAFHYFLAHGPLALFIQLPWGGAYTDPTQARAEIERILSWSESLPARLASLKDRMLIGPEKKLLVVLSRFSRSRWAWVSPPEADLQDIAWHSGDRMLGKIDEELESMATE